MEITIKTNDPLILENIIEQLSSRFPNDIQNQYKPVCSHTDFEKEPSITEPAVSPETGYGTENKSAGLAKILRRECTMIDRVVQNLLKKERKNRHLSKIGQQSYESLLLNQSANLLWLLSEHVIPQLERSPDNKNK